MIYISKITNKEQQYTMVDLFSTHKLALAFQEAFMDKFYKDEQNWMHKWDIQTESKELDSPDYPFLKD